MREPRRLARTPEAALDEVSDHMGEVLRRADELLADWSRFGDVVRVQVEREAAEIGDAVASSIDGAVIRGAAATVDRALAEQIGARLAGLTAELGRLEARARAVTRSLAEDRASDRRILWAVVAGVIAANALLVVLLLRPGPDRAPLEPAQLHQVAPSAAPAPVDAAVSDPPAAPGSAAAPAGSATPAPGRGSSSAAAAPAPAADAARDASHGGAATTAGGANATRQGAAGLESDRAASPGGAVKSAAAATPRPAAAAAPKLPAGASTPVRHGIPAKTRGAPVKRN